MTGRKTPQHHTGHTEPIRTPALRHSIDGNHPELREGQEDSALTADLRGRRQWTSFDMSHTDLGDMRAGSWRVYRRGSCGRARSSQSGKPVGLIAMSPAAAMRE